MGHPLLRLLIAIAYLLLILGLAVAALLALLATPAQAQDQWQYDFAYAAKWGKQVQANRRHAERHAWCLGERLPAKLRKVTECPTQPGDALADLPYRYDWYDYALAWRAQARRLAAYVRSSWRRIAHPRPLHDAGDWAPLLRHEGWPVAAIPHALLIIRRESGGSPTAWNRTTDCRGLFQLMRRYAPPGADLFDPVVNVRLALRWYRQRGWAPWAL